MTKLTKRFVEAVEPQSKGHVVWDDELPGFGLRDYSSGKRSYLIQHRVKGRLPRYTIGIYGVWTPKTTLRKAKALLGQVTQEEYPAAEREEERRAVTVGEVHCRHGSRPCSRERRPPDESGYRRDRLRSQSLPKGAFNLPDTIMGFR
ncbi:uncharacterized protein DUF4102 [Yoonia maricola]|uniref:Uncharacterized protein DUF4102 n=1 Tax=Yoonia maricola TaxID=420999 RepID=A0A2M8WM35_9RHOB|nr:Arm DNA-binding domain-containing protein [Yoonia maricola]PJI91992.1 uncharacterized protein DUF4102 [Yoonia maricola]